jgi:hypothetical protein
VVKALRKLSLLIFLLFPCLTLAQEISTSEVPRNEFGRPDFQGFWENLHEVPEQRSERFGTRRAYTEEEVVALMSEIRSGHTQRESSLAVGRLAPETGARITNRADDDFDEFPEELMRINGEYRTSIIIKPTNGRIQKKENVLDYYARFRDQGFRNYDGPEMTGANDRCLHMGWIFPYMGTTGLSKFGQIVQTEDFVMILGEYPYVPRIIPITSNEIGEDYFLDRFPVWMGHSFAYWEQDKLKVVTKKLRDEQSNAPANALSPNGLPVSSVTSSVEETYELLSANQILYRWEFTDEEFLSESVIGEVLLTRMLEGRRIYEYACHEGNYNMELILRGARRADWEDQQRSRPNQ